MSICDSSDCFMCRQYTQNIDRAEFVLPCFVPSGSLREADIQITYLFRRGYSGSGDSNQVPLNVHEEVGKNCHGEYFSAKLLDEVLMTPRPQRPRRSTFRADNLFMRDINPTTSYPLNIVESIDSFPPMSIVCLTNVKFIVAVRAHCDSYGLRNIFDDDDDWQLYSFTESDECLVCFFGTSGQKEAELVLPCWDKYKRRISRIIASYIFRRPGNGGNLSSISSNTTCEVEATFNTLLINSSTESVDHDETETITINVEQDDYSYHLKASGINPNSFICLRNVEYKCGSDFCTSDYSPVCGSDRQIYYSLCHLTNAACDDPDLVPVNDEECKPECGSDYCTSDYTPVCGSDRQIYYNLCHLTNAACVDPDIVQVNDGECKPVPPVTIAHPRPSTTSTSTSRVTTGSMPEGTGISTAAIANTTTVKIKTHGAPPVTIAHPRPSTTSTSTSRVTTAPPVTIAHPRPSTTSTSTSRATTAPPVTIAHPRPSTTSTSTSRVTTGSMPEGTGISTAATANTATIKIKTHGERRQSNFTIWVIFAIIAIMIISIFAVVLGVFIRQRKQHDHHPANNVTTGREHGESNGIKGDIKNSKDVILNPTYGQEPIDEKEEDYHSYTEIDVKVPGNSEMIYNSAYESLPTNTGMVYNCAYESGETNSGMIYNTAYEGFPSK